MSSVGGFPDVFIQKIPDDLQGEIPEPYDPDVPYPECPFGHSGSRNHVYEAVREIFRSSGYDQARFGTAQWNPLGDFISPGDTVLIKPNMVLHRSYRPGEDYHSVVTHPALVRSVVDYVYLALKGRGKILIGDAPINSADFSAVRRNMGLDRIVQLYATRDFQIEILDFRLYTMEKDEKGIIRNQQAINKKGDHVVVQFGERSMLTGIRAAYKHFRVTEYDGFEMPIRHNLESHEYCIHRSICDADVIVALPKIKTHHKAGLTCAMKNYVGINGSKDWLPHHRKFSIEEGGDEYWHKSFRKRLISGSWDLRWKIKSPLLQRLFRLYERTIYWTQHLVPFKDPYMEGSWWGNNTISRTVVDLNRAVLYCDKKGVLQDSPQRRLLYLVDGVICGEGEGPMGATSKRCNMLLWGFNSFAVDMVVATLMGFDFRRIDTFSVCKAVTRHQLFDRDWDSIRIRTNLEEGERTLDTIRGLIGYRFVPPHGWKGHVEIE